MKVFIENEAGSNQKNLFDEKSLEFKKAVTVSRKYPYPYGFILNTTSGDGDNVDAFIITDEHLKSGQIVDCEPIGLMEQMEKSWDETKGEIDDIDHNVLMVLEGSDENVVTDEAKECLTDFILHVFDHILPNKNRVGNFLGKEEALQFIKKCEDE
ncbi:MAG: inorganic diphosphatase [Patescibacteria group bacterium]